MEPDRRSGAENHPAAAEDSVAEHSVAEDLIASASIADVSEAFDGGGFGIFAKLIKEKGFAVRAIPAPGAGSPPRSVSVRFC